MLRRLKSIEFGGRTLVGFESWAAAVAKGELGLDTEIVGHFEDGGNLPSTPRKIRELRSLFPELRAQNAASAEQPAVRGDRGATEGPEQWKPVRFFSPPSDPAPAPPPRSAGRAPIQDDDRPWAEDLAVRDEAIASLRRHVDLLLERVGSLKEEIIASEYRCRALEQALRRLESRPAAPPATPPPPPLARSEPVQLAPALSKARLDPRSEPRLDPPPAVPRPAPAPAPAAPAPTTAAAPPPAPAFVPPALSEYLALLAGAKPRQFAAFFAGFDEVRSLHIKNDEAIAGAFTGNDADELLVALGHKGRYWVVPTYDYVSVFPTVFSDTIKNPQVIAHFFALEADGSGRLSLLAPATVRLHDKAQVELVERGRLAGFVS